MASYLLLAPHSHLAPIGAVEHGAGRAAIQQLRLIGERAGGGISHFRY